MIHGYPIINKHATYHHSGTNDMKSRGIKVYHPILQYILRQMHVISPGSEGVDTNKYVENYIIIIIIIYIHRSALEKYIMISTRWRSTSKPDLLRSQIYISKSIRICLWSVYGNSLISLFHFFFLKNLILRIQIIQTEDLHSPQVWNRRVV